MFSDPDAGKFIALGALINRMGSWLWPFVQALLVATVSAGAGAMGKTLMEKYIDENFKRRKRR